jgi:hypothetical protein
MSIITMLILRSTKFRRICLTGSLRRFSGLGTKDKKNPDFKELAYKTGRDELILYSKIKVGNNGERVDCYAWNALIVMQSYFRYFELIKFSTRLNQHPFQYVPEELALVEAIPAMLSNQIKLAFHSPVLHISLQSKKATFRTSNVLLILFNVSIKIDKINTSKLVLDVRVLYK